MKLASFCRRNSRGRVRLFLQRAVGDGDADLDVAELAKHEDEIVVTVVFIVAALETSQLATDDLDLFIELEVVRGKGDVVGRPGTVDGLLQL